MSRFFSLLSAWTALLGISVFYVGVLTVPNHWSAELRWGLAVAVCFALSGVAALASIALSLSGRGR